MMTIRRVVDSIVVAESVGCTMSPVLIQIIKRTLSNCSPLLLANLRSHIKNLMLLIDMWERERERCLLGGTHNQECRLGSCKSRIERNLISEAIWKEIRIQNSVVYFFLWKEAMTQNGTLLLLWAVA